MHCYYFVGIAAHAAKPTGQDAYSNCTAHAATGSKLPARLANARDLSIRCEFAETKTAYTELAVIGTRAAAAIATVMLAGRKFRYPLCLDSKG
jgi:hypothetical protein